jgi:hypothetical protein
VELFLNLVWLFVSLLLIFGWGHAIVRGKCAREKWVSAVALVLLVVLLFPVISMTDDLVAMAAPDEGEHAVRRAEATLLQAACAYSVDVFALAAFLFVGLASLAMSPVRLRPLRSRFVLSSGCVRTTSIRPPPSYLLAT